MELDEFVKKVLVDLNNAVDGAREETSRDLYFKSSGESPTVQFDIAVSAENISAASGKAGVKVLTFVEGGGEISESNKNSTVSRVRFGIEVKTLTKEEETERLARRKVSHGRTNSMFYGFQS